MWKIQTLDTDINLARSVPRHILYILHADRICQAVSCGGNNSIKLVSLSCQCFPVAIKEKLLFDTNENFTEDYLKNCICQSLILIPLFFMPRIIVSETGLSNLLAMNWKDQSSTRYQYLHY